MNILFITPSFPREKDGDNIYTDLAEKLAEENNIDIVVAEEKRKIKETEIKKERNIDVLRVKIGNLYGVSFIEKGITFITMQNKLKKAIKKYLNNKKYDLILFMAPPVTLGSVVKFAMKKYNAKSYLMQKDIFPQNSLDLGIMSKKNPMYYYFKQKEKITYKVASVIGCMSEGNIEYLLRNNAYLSKEKLEMFPNTITLKEINKEQGDIRKKYGIDEEKVIAIYGGNFGKPQGVDFIKEVIQKYKNDERVLFFFSGKGTEKEKLFKYIIDNKINNVIIQDYIPRSEYVQILKQADIGLIFLDHRFTIPNIPSRTLSYFEYSLPIMASTDKYTDYKDILAESGAGLWCESNNIEEFCKKFELLLNDKVKRVKMGSNGRKYLEENWTTDKSVEILKNHLKDFKN